MRLGEAYLFYSSLTLLVMGCLTFVLSVFFRLRFHVVEGVPKSLSASVFNKTFNVLNPYPESRKVIHNFLVVLPVLMFFVSLGFVVVAWKIIEYGFALSLVVLIVCLNLMVLDVAYEISQNAEILIRAVRCDTSFGVGDLKVFQIVRKALPRLSNFYLGLTILFVVLAVTLGYIWSSALWFMAWFVGLMFEASAVTGPVGWEVAVFLFALVVFVIQVFVLRVKRRFLRYLVELPAGVD